MNDNSEFWPGHIKLDTGTSERHSPGNRAVLLRTDIPEAMGVDVLLNDFSRSNPNALISSIIPLSPTSLLVLYTAVMSSEKIREMGELHKLAEGLYEERQKKKNEAEEAAAKAQLLRETEAKEKADADAKELARLAELGRRHEKNCKGKK